MKNGFTIRLAQDADSERVHELVSAAGFAIEGVDWRELYPYWLVVETRLRQGSGGQDGLSIVGCLQVCPGKPIGRLELLAADKGLSHRDRANTVKLLVTSGMETLRQGGSKLASGIVPFEERAYKRLLKKRGAVVVATGNLMMARL